MKNSLISEKATFSILMANYNNAKYIGEAIRSVISQTYPIWELIIVDDCSSDNSIEKIQPFLNNKQIKLIRHKKNIGYGGTLKTAANNASNKIFGILDADDKLHEKALEIMAEAYQNNPDCGFIYSTMWGCDSDLKNCKVAKWIGSIIPEKTSIFKSKISHFKTFRRDDYEKTPGYETNQKKSVDKDLIYKLEEVTKFKFINVPLYYYRHHERGISQGKNKYSARVYHYVSKCKTYRRRLISNLPNFTKKELYIEYYKITFYKLIICLKYLCRMFNISRLIELILKVFPIMPRNIKKKLQILKGKL